MVYKYLSLATATTFPFQPPTMSSLIDPALFDESDTLPLRKTFEKQQRLLRKRKPLFYGRRLLTYLGQVGNADQQDLSGLGITGNAPLVHYNVSH